MLWWLAGVAGLFVVAAALVLLIARRPRLKRGIPPWDIPAIAQRYIYIVGTLSGFSVASATFLAGFIERSGSAELATVIGMFLMAFLVFVGTAMIFGSVPGNLTEQAAGDAGIGWQYTIHMLGNCGYYIGLTLSWFALRPFLLGIKLNFLADIFTWILLLSGFAAAGRLSLQLYLLTSHNIHACLNLPVIGFGLAALYRFALVPYWPSLWPAEQAPLLFSVVLFGLMMVLFMADGLLLLFGARAAVSRWIAGPANPAMIAFVQLTIVTAALVWLSISGLG